MHLILYGFKAAGKTTLGRQLASLGKLPFFDTDEWILRHHFEQGSIRKLVQNKGEPFFRKWEKKAIEALKTEPKSVVALGGSTLFDLGNLAALKKIGHLFYLEVDFEVAFERMAQDPWPTFVDPDHPRESFLQEYQRRKPLYERIRDELE